MRIGRDWFVPHHWHLVLLPNHDDDLSDFLQRLSMAHARQKYERVGRDMPSKLRRAFTARRMTMRNSSQLISCLINALE